MESERVEMAEVGAGGTRALVPGLPDSFAAEFEHLYECAYRATYRLLGNQLDAEHVAQEACSQRRRALGPADSPPRARTLGGEGRGGARDRAVRASPA